MHDTLYPIYFVLMLPYLAELILAKIKILCNKQAYKIEFSDLKNGKYLVILMFLCVFTGLITPLFGTAYTNMIECLSGVSTDFIAELQPTKLLEKPLLLFFIVIEIAIIGFTKTKIKLKDLLFSFGFIAFSLISVRNVFFMDLLGTVSVSIIFAQFVKCYLGEEFWVNLDNKISKSHIILFIIILIIDRKSVV